MILKGVYTFIWLLVSVASLASGISEETVSTTAPTTSDTENSTETNQLENVSLKSTENLATFAGGCFWGVEHKFKQKFGKGLISTKVGYTGGNKTDPKYKEVSSGQTGHAESVQFEFDPKETAYEELVLFFWRIHDPTTLNKQGNDMGTCYRSAVFYHSESQKEIAERVIEVVKPKFKDPIVTEITAATTFYPAEDYHQNYLEKNPNGYCNHRMYW